MTYKMQIADRTIRAYMKSWGFTSQSVLLAGKLIASNIELHLLCIRVSAEGSILYYLYVMSYLEPVATAPIKQKLLTKLFNFAPIDTDEESQYYKDRRELVLRQLEAIIINNEQQIPLEEAVTQRAEQFIEKVGQVAANKAALAAKQEELTATYTRDLQKFTLQAEDDQYLQWAKILKVVALAQNASDNATLYAHVEHVLEEHMRLCPESIAYAHAALIFYRQLAKGQLKPCDIIVIGTKDNAPHPLCKVGKSGGQTTSPFYASMHQASCKE